MNNVTEYDKNKYLKEINLKEKELRELKKKISSLRERKRIS